MLDRSKVRKNLPEQTLQPHHVKGLEGGWVHLLYALDKNGEMEEDREHSLQLLSALFFLQ